MKKKGEREKNETGREENERGREEKEREKEKHEENVTFRLPETAKNEALDSDFDLDDFG